MCLRIYGYLLKYVGDVPNFGYTLRINSLHNDSWINFHMRGLLIMWLANMDFQIVLDIDKVIAYMTKHVTRPEVK